MTEKWEYYHITDKDDKYIGIRSLLPRMVTSLREKGYSVQLTCPPAK